MHAKHTIITIRAVDIARLIAGKYEKQRDSLQSLELDCRYAERFGDLHRTRATMASTLPKSEATAPWRRRASGLQRAPGQPPPSMRGAAHRAPVE